MGAANSNERRIELWHLQVGTSPALPPWSTEWVVK
jgi:hypothetical protein